jgi:hypothetical protein
MKTYRALAVSLAGADSPANLDHETGSLDVRVN